MLTYNPPRGAEWSFRPPLEWSVDYVREIQAWELANGKIVMSVRGQWTTNAGARSRQQRSAIVDVDDDSNPEWLKALIKDAQRRLK